MHLNPFMQAQCMQWCIPFMFCMHCMLNRFTILHCHTQMRLQTNQNKKLGWFFSNSIHCSNSPFYPSMRMTSEYNLSANTDPWWFCVDSGSQYCISHETFTKFNHWNQVINCHMKHIELGCRLATTWFHNAETGTFFRRFVVKSPWPICLEFRNGLNFINIGLAFLKPRTKCPILTIELLLQD